MKKRGNCYITCEALYHLLGGKASGYKPMYMKHEGTSHWFLQLTFGWAAYDKKTIIIDPTVKQFKNKPDYSKAKGKGFLTKRPSKKARALMKILLWA